CISSFNLLTHILPPIRIFFLPDLPGSDPACVPSLLSGTDSQSMPQTPSRDDNLPWTHALPLWGNVHSFPFCKSYTLLLSAKAPECPSWQTASAPSPADLPFC